MLLFSKYSSDANKMEINLPICGFSWCDKWDVEGVETAGAHRRGIDSYLIIFQVGLDITSPK